MASSAREYFDRMPAAFSPAAAAGLSATYQFDLAGEGGGHWVVTVQGGGVTVEEGRRADADVVISATAADYVAIAEGQKSSTWALAFGRFRIQGSLRLAMKLPKLFPR